MDATSLLSKLRLLRAEVSASGRPRSYPTWGGEPVVFSLAERLGAIDRAIAVLSEEAADDRGMGASAQGQGMRP